MFADLRKIHRPTGPRIVEKTIDTPTDQAFVYSGFYGADESNRDDVRALGMAARVLSTRMIKEVREEGQLVYSIGAQSRPGTTYPGFGVFSANATTDPEKVPALVSKLASMYQVQAVPTLVVFKAGQPVKRIEGVVPEASLRAELEAAGS